MVGGREAAGPGADNQHPLPRGVSRRVGRPALAQRPIAEEPLHGVDPHGLVHCGPVAGRLARVEAGSSHDGGERVVPHDLAPGRLVGAVLGEVEPLLDVLAGRAGVAARGETVDVHRALDPPRARLVGEARSDLEGDGEWLLGHGAGTSRALEEAVAGDVAVGHRLQSSDDVRPGRVPLRVEEVCEAALQAQVLLDRGRPADGRRAHDLAVLRLEDREEARLGREPGDLHRVARSRAPPERARHQDVDVAGAVDLHGPGDLVLEVVEVGHRGGRHVGDPVRHRQLGHVLALPEGVPRMGADRLGGGRPCRRRRCPRPLHAGVHVGLVVVADEQDVVVALEHAREAAEADVHRAAIAGLRDHPRVAPALDPQRRRDPGRYCGGVAEQGMQPRDLPRRLRVGRREHLEAAGGVDGHHPAAGRAHGRIDGVTGAERLAAALAGAVA